MEATCGKAAQTHWFTATDGHRYDGRRGVWWTGRVARRHHKLVGGRTRPRGTHCYCRAYNTGTATSAPATGVAMAASAPATGASGMEVTTATPTSATEVPGREVPTHPVRGPTSMLKSYPRRERHMTDRYNYEPVWSLAKEEGV